MTDATWAGSYHRSRRERFVLRLLSELDIAVRAGVPLNEALRMLAADLHGRSIRARLARVLCRCSVPTFGSWLFSPSACQALRVEQLADKLEQGIPLGAALAADWADDLPAHIPAALLEAAKAGTMEAVLPDLVQRLRYQRAVKDDRMPYWPLLLFQLVMILSIRQGLNAFIMPVFGCMFADFSMPPPRLAMVLMTGVTNVLLVMAVLLGLALVVVKVAYLRDRVLLWIPGVAAERKRLLVRELAQSMVAFLRGGADIVAAAERSLALTRAPWLKARLQDFVERTRKGENWGKAWDAMNLGACTHPWIILNAAEREDAVGGFARLSEWLHDDISRTTRLVRRWFMPCMVIVMGVLVGSVIAPVFIFMARMTETVYLPGPGSL